MATQNSSRERKGAPNSLYDLSIQSNLPLGLDNEQEAEIKRQSNLIKLHQKSLERPKNPKILDLSKLPTNLPTENS